MGKKIKFQKAFTLLELLVVITIIGILSSIVIVSMSGSTDSAEIAKGKSFSQQVHALLGYEARGVWNFDEGTVNTCSATQDACDLSGYNNHGTFVGNTDYVESDIEGYALSFDGTGDYVDCGEGSSSFIIGGRDHTLEAWMYPTGFASTYNYIASIGDSLTGKQSSFGIVNDLRLFLSAYSSPIAHTSYALPALNDWYHIVMSYDGNSDTASFYVNGEWKEDEIISLDVTVGKCRIGSNVGNGSLFIGLIDEVRIYATALSRAEIRDNYVQGLKKMLVKNVILENNAFTE